jgi:uncharacterized membrane protein YfcA
MSRTQFRIVVFSLLFAGLGVMIGSLYAKDEKTKTIMLSITGALYLAAAVQIVIYRRKPRGVDHKPSGMDQKPGEKN